MLDPRQKKTQNQVIYQFIINHTIMYTGNRIRYDV